MDGANFQRVGAPSNSRVGADFESAALRRLAQHGLVVRPKFSVLVGVSSLKKLHQFDLGSDDPPVLVECKSHRWTVGRNSPSAKLTVWNEAMYYFHIAPAGFRCILFVLRDYHEGRRLTLGEYYLQRYTHLIPEHVELWEYDAADETHRVLHPRERS